MLAPAALAGVAGEGARRPALADDAHGIGGGRRLAVATSAEAQRRTALRLSSFPKAIFGYGGYLFASRPLMLINSRARHLVIRPAFPRQSAACRHRRAGHDLNPAGYAALPVSKAAGFFTVAQPARSGEPDCPDPHRRRQGGARRLRRPGAHVFLFVASARQLVSPCLLGCASLQPHASPDREIDALPDAKSGLIINRMTALFVTAPGTDIVKTFLTAGLNPRRRHRACRHGRGRQSGNQSAFPRTGLGRKRYRRLAAAMGLPLNRALSLHSYSLSLHRPAVARHGA